MDYWIEPYQIQIFWLSLVKQMCIIIQNLSWHDSILIFVSRMYSIFIPFLNFKFYYYFMLKFNLFFIN